MRTAAHLRDAHLAALADTVASVSAADPVAAFLQQVITAAATSLAILPPPGTPLDQREAAIDRILTLMHPYTLDTMLADVDLRL
jgi:hypothetical protein